MALQHIGSKQMSSPTNVVTSDENSKIKSLTKSESVVRVLMQQDRVSIRTVPAGLNDYAESQTPGKLGGLEHW